MSEYDSIEAFWPYYVREHSQPLTRWLHFIGNTNLFFWLASALVRRRPSLIVVAVVSSYAIAWIGHFFVERNRPATFQYPLLAALCDMRMYYLMWVGKMDDEIALYAKEPETS